MQRSPARMWLTILGVVLVLTAILGLIQPIVDLMHNLGFNIEGGEDAVHWALAILTLGMAFGIKDDALLNTLTIVYGAIYLAVGVFGFIMPSIDGIWHVAIADDILHLALGLITLGAGLASRRQMTNPA